MKNTPETRNRRFERAIERVKALRAQLTDAECEAINAYDAIIEHGDPYPTYPDGNPVTGIIGYLDDVQA